MSAEPWTTSMRRSGGNLFAFGLAAVVLLASVHQCAAPRIVAAQEAARRAALLQMLPAGSFDNDLLADRIHWPLPEAWSAPGVDMIWRARKHGKVVAFILPLRAPEGYSGPIDLLLAATPQGQVLGLRVVAHRETPGLGDGIERQRSDWATQFPNQGLPAVAASDWRIRKDGGVFDHLSGATITSRTVVDTMREALLYLQEQASALAEQPALELQDD